MRGRGFVSLGIIVSKLQVRYFQPGTATSPSIVLPFLFSYVFHFRRDHAFNNRSCTTLAANLVTKKLEIFRTNEHFWRGPRISISDDFPRGAIELFLRFRPNKNSGQHLPPNDEKQRYNRATITKPKISNFESDMEETRMENSIRLTRRLLEKPLFLYSTMLARTISWPTRLPGS